MNSVSENKTDVIGQLRLFHYGQPAAAAATTRPSGTVLPALLNAYRDASVIRYQYPLYLAPVGDGEAIAKPVSELFASVQAGMLKDNLPWIERFLKQKLVNDEPVDASALFAEAASALQDQLDLDPANREKLGAELENLGSTIGAGGQFLGYGPSVPLQLLLHAIRHRDTAKREQLRKRIARHIQGLTELIDIEEARSTSSNVGQGSQYFDDGALTGMLEHRVEGSVEMPVSRRARIEITLRALQAWQDETPLARFVGQVDDAWFSGVPELDVVASDDPCNDAAQIYEQETARFAGLFAALRTAALEIDGHYDPDIHDSWFEHFDWQAFTDDEMQSVTRIVALVPANQLAGNDLPAFSRLLGSRLPVHVVSWVRAYDNPCAQSGEGPFDSYRFELGYFGIGHRQAVVSQASAARHEDLLSGFLCALDCNRTSLHLVNRGTQSRAKKPLLDPWFVASAALESRAHPFVLVNPESGDHAVQRVSFAGNPQPENDWPVEKLEYEDADGNATEMELAFTFADYALLMPTLHEHFRMVPPGLESADLIAVDQYLDAGDDVDDRAIPFVWAIDEQGVLTRLVVSRALVFACRDRLNYWHSLQELAGVRNVYVEDAIDRIVEEQRAAIDAEREQLKKEHEEALESARSEAAGEAMGELVDFLMGADLSGMVAGESTVATMPAPAEPEAEDEVVAAEPEPVVEEEPEEEISFDEPWLDTASCTTCDDCMNINKMMFAYNDDKQAYIKDPKAGPYADLVAAAEICPAKCIHPGKPLDPNEPGLEELIARAEPFN